MLWTQTITKGIEKLFPLLKGIFWTDSLWKYMLMKAQNKEQPSKPRHHQSQSCYQWIQQARISKINTPV